MVLLYGGFLYLHISATAHVLLTSFEGGKTEYPFVFAPHAQVDFASNSTTQTINL